MLTGAEFEHTGASLDYWEVLSPGNLALHCNETITATYKGGFHL